ncbi:DUF4331 domain-containing protein [Luteibacter yeojuensis]|uniref:DUF4331 domain-containing protein n=1 Tax=Luteibacter yeojuensis TaxID=345309 RepID=A0A0F3L456_9GAMM|nr:DUF4331 domain-containing protein [Luteibacter yeojuensis]KJV37129.1 hypothetical protein VI08_00940 [Luteibacter yeojuensis]
MTLTCLAAAMALLPALAAASSHREAPFIATQPQVDASDFYMFMSYEANRPGYVTLLANYDPMQDAYSGPNFHFLDDNAVYDFHIDSTGRGKSDLTFRFHFNNRNKDLTVPAGGVNQAQPLLNIGPVSATDQSNLNRTETYSVEVMKGESPLWRGQALTNAASGSGVFTKPVDNIGNKSIANYEAYAGNYVYNVKIPGCAAPGRVFAGQRKDGFVADLGAIFDLVNLNPLGPRDGTPNALTRKNVTTLALEIPATCLGATAKQTIIGGWTTASQPRYRVLNNNDAPFSFADLVQVSRLGSPLVNELVIGLKDKDRFNASQPSRDKQFLSYVTNPTVPVLVNALFGVPPPHTPRNDLVSVFLTGVAGLNQPANVVPAEELRLNTSIAPTPPASQNDLGVLGNDLAGFPNGRRPYDDVVDIALRAEEGALCSTAIGTCGDQTADPNNGAPLTDGARAAGATAATSTVSGSVSAADTYLDHFPYLNTPVPGSVNASMAAQ